MSRRLGVRFYITSDNCYEALIVSYILPVQGRFILISFIPHYVSYSKLVLPEKYNVIKTTNADCY